MISGNFSWLNFLTIALGALGDRRLGAGPRAARRPAGRPRDDPRLADRAHRRAGGVRRRCAASRSSPTSCRRHQRMNASFDRLHLVNTYGAFGSVTKVRREVIIEGTLDERPGARHRVARVRGARQARRRAAPAAAGRAVPPAPRLAPVVRRALALATARAGCGRCSASCSRPTPPRWRCSTTTPSTAQPPGVRAGPAVPLRAHDPAGAARDGRVVATRSRPATLQAPMGFARR